jgi:predicted TIM-barrel fold metal-dependent hydrolase
MALDGAGLSHGVLLSAGYMFAGPAMAEMKYDVRSLTRAENAFVVAQAVRHPKRLTAFVSVNPLHPSALDEIGYWAGRRGASGLKLHLANSQPSFRNPEHVRKLAAVFEAAGRARLPIAIHLRTEDEAYGAEDIRIFLDRVMPKSGGLPVQVSHGGGWGGFDAQDAAALGEFAAAFERRHPATRLIWFDLAAIAISITPKEQYPLVASLIRRVGLDRMLMGSDWFALETPVVHFRQARESIPLTEPEWDQVMRNKAPYLSSGRRGR